MGLRNLMLPTRTSASPSLIDPTVPVTANDTTRTLCPSPIGRGRRTAGAAGEAPNFDGGSIFPFSLLNSLAASAFALSSRFRYFLTDSSPTDSSSREARSDIS